MSLLTKASLIATPTAYGDGVLNSVKPTNGDGDFDFARASSATRVNEEGLIEKERENLFTDSNDFGTASWGGSITRTSGQSGYDGSSNAWLIQNAVASAYIRQNTTLSGVLTASIYAKAGNVNWMRFAVSNSPIVSIYFDLVNGVGYDASNLISHDIEDVGGGWHRYSVSFLANSMSGMQWYPADANNDLGEVGDNIYIQDAQLENGLVARDYIETTTTSVAVGITNDIPRINYENGIGNFLLEGQRTNSITQSEYFGGWNIVTNVTLNHNDSDSPEGVSNATEIVPNTSNDIHFIDKSGFNRTSGEYITTTIYAKESGYDYLYLSLSASRLYGVFDISNGAVMLTSSNGTAFNNDSGSIESVGNGWYRCTLIGQAQDSGSTYLRVSCAPTSSNTHTPTFAGDGTSGVLVYGAQVETNSSYPTSYIPTYGSAVTRLAETCNNAGNSDLFNDSEGVLYAEIAALADDATVHPITLGDGTSSNRIQLFYFNGVSIYGACIVGGVSQASIFKNTNVTNYIKAAFKYKANDFSLWVNGFEVGVDVGGSVPIGLNTLNFDNGVGAVDFYGKTKMVSTFKEALSDSELECLTSWSSFERMATAQNYTIE